MFNRFKLDQLSQNQLQTLRGGIDKKKTSKKQTKSSSRDSGGYNVGDLDTSQGFNEDDWLA